MPRACTPGLVRRWSFYVFPDDDLTRHVPEEGDIAVHPDTGSCYLILAVKPSPRKAEGWFTMKIEGLGAGAAELGDEGTFSYKNLSKADYEAIHMIEQAEREASGA